MPRTLIFEISGGDMMDLLLGVKRLMLPPGAKIASWWRDVHWEDAIQRGEAFFIRVEHESYPEVEPGRRIAQRPAEFRVIENRTGRKPAAFETVKRSLTVHKERSKTRTARAS
jgi:hypothetical protein